MGVLPIFPNACCREALSPLTGPHGQQRPLNFRPLPPPQRPAPTAPGRRSRRRPGPAPRTRRSSSPCWGHRGRRSSGSTGSLRGGSGERSAGEGPAPTPTVPTAPQRPLTVLRARNRLHRRAPPPPRPSQSRRAPSEGPPREGRGGAGAPRLPHAEPLLCGEGREGEGGAGGRPQLFRRVRNASKIKTS